MKKPKRFYGDVLVAPSDSGFQIQLDGKPVRTPARALLAVPGHALGEAIAKEWRDQDKEVAPETMPFTKLAFTAIDRVAPDRDSVVEQLLRFADADVTCYRASEPAALVERQRTAWNPLLEWARREFGFDLRTSEGINYQAQSPEFRAALTHVLSPLSDFHLAAVFILASNADSLVIALAVARGALDPEAAFLCANCDELFQLEKWGADADAQLRLDARAEEFRAAAEFLRILGGLKLTG